MCLVCEKSFSNKAMKPSRLLEHLLKIHADKSGILSFSSRSIFEAKNNEYVYFSSKNSDDGLKASYNISLLIAKAGKPQTIGEELILPAVKEVIKTVLHKSPEKVIKSIPLSDNSVQRKWLKTSKRPSVRCWWQLSSVCSWTNPLFQETNRYFSHMYASSKVGHCVKNYCLHVSWKQIPKGNQCIELWRTISRKKNSAYKHHLVLQMAPRPWLVATVDF